MICSTLKQTEKVTHYFGKEEMITAEIHASNVYNNLQNLFILLSTNYDNFYEDKNQKTFSKALFLSLFLLQCLGTIKICFMGIKIIFWAF